ncbi:MULTISPECIES: RNA-directed DNA polymerase [Staphylococcus]|uniref:RNA-directed DNA polymerase n=1 Tax=Staphylococcus TaxID=1279 RepID=UPI001881EF10|nr:MULTISPECIES: RNA-directed DNA polymerase [unclassified Staphylococcus]MBF2756491.1 RNA-directed DNA polymerase [Staphylococcus haemolyticus]MBF2773739.1 RNA-directed DNA polymerase [Staphylococcus haemolyticus]MBF2775855.1 RNA-directed DNA polymerase [Staphylococcus haemolyticus]MBF2815424.1 RNA-directed DNA polymerase [Staphylococcus haemolyticus]MBF9719802.1 RNA-directed DNA polymerase [Staphylococcus haemolyticus]
MKKYYEYIEEITKDEVLEEFISYGLFNDKLPPFLQSKEYYQYYKNTNIKFDKNMKKPKTYILYESYRNINIPRQLAIPNPFSYSLQCETLSENWTEYVNHFQKLTENQHFKISRIHIRKKSKKNGLFEMNYSNYKIDGSPNIDLLIGAKYKVSADISNCFPSIYTHAITWALISKIEAKKYKSRQYQNEWFNEIDLYTRNMKEGETHGLLIGPHTSNLLAEVILCEIDNNLHSEKFNYIRNIDDYTCYTASISEANNFLYSLQKHLRNYGLSLNYKKTKIDKLPKETEENWIRNIKTFFIKNSNDYIDYNSCKYYMNLAISLAEKESNAAIINYATKVLNKERLSNNAKRYLTKVWFHLAIIYPYLLPLLEEQILSLKQFNESELKGVLYQIYKENYRINNYEGVSYALYLAVKYNINILNTEEYDELINCEDCLLLLILYMYGMAFKFGKGKKKLTKLAKDLSKDNFDAYWLFIYEVLSKEQLSKQEWKAMKEKGISFIKYEFNLYSIFNAFDHSNIN